MEINIWEPSVCRWINSKAFRRDEISGMSIDGKEKNTKSPASRVCRNEGEPTKKIEKEQSERERRRTRSVML